MTVMVMLHIKGEVLWLVPLEVLCAPHLPPNPSQATVEKAQEKYHLAPPPPRSRRVCTRKSPLAKKGRCCCAASSVGASGGAMCAPTFLLLGAGWCPEAVGVLVENF